MCSLRVVKLSVSEGKGGDAKALILAASCFKVSIVLARGMCEKRELVQCGSFWNAIRVMGYNLLEWVAFRCKTPFPAFPRVAGQGDI